MKYILISLFILILPVFSVCACTVPGANRQNGLVNVVWTADENEYGIDLSFTVFDRNGARYGTFKYDDSEYDIVLGWSKGKVIIDSIGYYGNPIGKGYDGNGFEITGFYTIIEKAVVEIKFNNIYGDFEELKSLKDKKITVRATAIDQNGFGVGEINNVRLESQDGKWRLYTYDGMRRFSIGTYGIGESAAEVAAFWLADGTFKVYKLKERQQFSEYVGFYIDSDRLDGNAIITGTYTNDSKQLNLDYDAEQATLYFLEIDEWLYRPVWYPGFAPLS